MPFDSLSNADLNRLTGTTQITNDPNGNAGILKLDTLALTTGVVTGQAIATGNTIVIPANQSVVRLTAGAAATGVIMPAGTTNGQIVILQISTAAANTITFAAAGTSNVAGGAGVSLAGLAAHALVWDATSELWYQVGPLAN